MNANRKRNAAALVLIAPLMLGAAFMPQAHAAGTITLSGFSAARAPHVLLQAESLMFTGRIGHIKASCNGKPLAISQTQPLYKDNEQLARECPAGGLAVTLTSHRLTAKELKAEESADSKLFRSGN